DVTGEVVRHARARSAWLLVVAPAGASQHPATALRELDPHTARTFQLGAVAAVSRVGVLLAGVRRQSTGTDQLVGLVAEYPPKRHNVAVEVVDGLHAGRSLGEQ